MVLNLTGQAVTAESGTEIFTNLQNKVLVKTRIIFVLGSNQFFKIQVFNNWREIYIYITFILIYGYKTLYS